MRAIGTVLIALAGMARAAPPPVIAPEEARRHVGEIVTVEGEVVSARSTGDTCVLELGPDAGGFRVVLLLPVFSDLPEHPERLYQGRRVRATGLVQRFRGVPEMVVRGPGRIEVVGFGATEPPLAPTPAPPTPPGAPAADRCARARARWREASVTAREQAAALTRCLQATGYRCRAESAALAPTLAGLEWAEQQVEAACE
jgi:hypothetical protein